jgi:tetratricopeptide (TPR) repeat protein
MAVRLALPFITAMVLLFPFWAWATETPEQTAARGRAERTYLLAHQRVQSAPADAEAAWLLGRACFDVADLTEKNAVRAERAQEGIAACRQAMALNPKLVQGPYYLGLNLGQLARTKSMGALKLLPQMETYLKKAIALDPTFDFSGPHRSLGLLYLDAPGWPVSLGSRSKARFHLQKAVELSPDFPENRLALLEAYWKWGEHELVLAQLPAAEQVFKAARSKLTGEDWAVSWQDWTRRLEQLQAKARTLATAPHAQSLRDRNP